MISTKVFDGFSTCFRQWKAENTHCKFLHGYGVSFKVWFEGDLDDRNWVFDFGGMKRSTTLINGMKPVDYFNWLFDHTVCVAIDDPFLSEFKMLSELDLIRLRVFPKVGCEVFAKLLFDELSKFVKTETNGRVKIKQVEFFEHPKNSAIARE